MKAWSSEDEEVAVADLSSVTPRRARDVAISGVEASVSERKISVDGTRSLKHPSSEREVGEEKKGGR